MSGTDAENTPSLDWDVVVIGSGHAGSCAALSAVDHGAPAPRVLILDKCPAEWAGGNGFFTAGAHRTVHGGLADLLPLVSPHPAIAPRPCARATNEYALTCIIDQDHQGSVEKA